MKNTDMLFAIAAAILLAGVSANANEDYSTAPSSQVAVASTSAPANTDQRPAAPTQPR